MNKYELKKNAKKIYFAEKAKKFKEQAQAMYEKSNQCVKNIPPGQPILVGHHSESRHRNALRRSHNYMGKSIELQKKAEYYVQKANAQNSVISIEDDAAIAKLKEKLKKLETLQAEMKRINSEYRKSEINAITGLNEQEKEQIKTDMQKCHWEKSPFPSYKLTNNNAEIRRIKKRIAEIEKLAQLSPAEDRRFTHFTVKENKEDMRIWFVFDEKPKPEICKIMRKYGFKFSYSRKAWVRLLNMAGKNSAEDAIREILKFVN